MSKRGLGTGIAGTSGGGGGGTPGGIEGSIQYNSAGTFGGSPQCILGTYPTGFNINAPGNAALGAELSLTCDDTFGGFTLSYYRGSGAPNPVTNIPVTRLENVGELYCSSGGGYDLWLTGGKNIIAEAQDNFLIQCVNNDIDLVAADRVFFNCVEADIKINSQNFARLRIGGPVINGSLTITCSPVLNSNTIASQDRKLEIAAPDVIFAETTGAIHYAQSYLNANEFLALGPSKELISLPAPSGIQQAAISTFQVALGETPLAIWGGGAGTMGNTYLSYSFAQTDMVITEMTCICDQSGGDPSSSIKMGIYDLSGNKLAETISMAGPVAVGSITLPLTAPLNLPQGLYYLAIFGSLNGPQFLGVQNKYGGANPVISYLVPNSIGLPAIAVPSNPQTTRFYVAAIGA